MQLRQLERFLEFVPQRMSTMSRPERLVAVVAEAIVLMEKMSKHPNRSESLSYFFHGLQSASTMSMDVDDVTATSPTTAFSVTGSNMATIVLSLRGAGHETQNVHILQFVLRLLQRPHATTATAHGTTLADGFSVPIAGSATHLRGSDGSLIVMRPTSLDKRLTEQLATMGGDVFEDWLQCKLVATASASESGSARAPSGPASAVRPPSAFDHGEDAIAVWQLVEQLMRKLLSTEEIDQEHASAKQTLGDRLWRQLRRMLWPSVSTWRGESIARIFAFLEWMAVEQGRIPDLVAITLDLLNEVVRHHEKIEASAPTLSGSSAHSHAHSVAASAVWTLLDFLQRVLDSCMLSGSTTATLSSSKRRDAASSTEAVAVDKVAAGAADCEMVDAEVDAYAAPRVALMRSLPTHAIALS